MGTSINRILTQIREAFVKMDKKRKRGLFIIAFLIVAFAIVGVVLLNQVTYVPINNFETVAQAEQAFARLQGIGVNARREGTRILVPEGDMEIAFTELRDSIGSPNFNTSIMDNASGFGVTDMHQRELYGRQLADDIRVAIMQSPRISNALVIIRQGQSSPFRTQNNLNQPIASVMVTLTDGGVLSQQEAQTIASIVSGAVQGITYENIQIVDSNLNQYKVGDANQDFETVLNSRAAMKNMLEQQVRLSIEQVLSRVFTTSNLEVLPAITLNFDKVSETEITFAPPIEGEMEGLVRSESIVWELSRTRGDASGIPGTDTNNMGMGEYPWGELGDDEEYKRSVSERNYELNETIKTIEREEGYIETMSVGILINSEVYSDDMYEDVIELISAGVDIPPERVSVVSMEFQVDTSFESEFEAWEQHEANLRQQDLIKQIILAVIAVTIAILAFMLGKSIVNAAKPPPLVPAEGAGIDLLVGGDEDEEARLAAELEAQRLEELDLQAKQTELSSIEGFIEKDPAAVAQLLRNWLTDDEF